MFDAVAEVSPQRWCVAICTPRAEMVAAMQAREIGLPVFLPLREEPPTRDRPIRIVPIWPGYLFVGASRIPEEVRAARRVIVTQDGSPIYAPKGLVEHLIDTADADGLIEKYQPPQEYKPRIGDTVRIRYGACAGQFAVITWLRGQAVHLKLSCAGVFDLIKTKLERIEAAV